MKKTALCIGFFVLLLPGVVVAGAAMSTQSISCSDKGYTVIFVNGILGDLQRAQIDAENLQHKIGYKFNSEPITVQVGYNPTHLAGAADLVQTTAQMFDGTISNYDRDTILLQIYPEVTTRKLILVGHSQGAFYTNEMYWYLADHGEPAEAVSVYNVGSPAAYTAGGTRGNYLNSSGDELLKFLRALNFSVLPNNIDIAADTSPDGWDGHGFSDTYLAGASQRMIDDLHAQMQSLVPTYSSATGDCFTPPDLSVGYRLQQISFAVADPTATAVKVGSTVVVQGAIAVLQGAATLAQGTAQFFSDTITVTTTPPSEKEVTEKNFSVMKKLYGSSLDTADVKELLGTSQGSAVALALPQEKPVAINGGFVEGTSTDAAHSVQEIAVIATTTPTIFPYIPPAPSTPTQENMQSVAAVSYTEAADTNQNVPEATTTEATTTEEVVIEQPILPPEPPALVINEIQWAGDAVNSGREWIELKNFSDTSIDLSHLSIVATEGGAQYIKLSGTVNASGFFIVQRDSLAPLNPAANPSFDFSSVLQIASFDALDDAGEQLALVEVGAWGTTTVDITAPVSACGGWCAGATRQGSGLGATLSMERIDAHTPGDSASNWASNDTYTASANMPGGDGQALYATVLQENSKHWPEFGWFCDPDTASITSGQQYRPQPSGFCTYLARFIAWPGVVSAGLFKGTMGSSTVVSWRDGGYPGSGYLRLPADDISSAQPGDQFFVAIWSPRRGMWPDPADNSSFVSWFTTGHRLYRDGFDSSAPLVVAADTNPPLDLYRVMPFTYGP